MLAKENLTYTIFQQWTYELNKLVKLIETINLFVQLYI